MPKEDSVEAAWDQPLHPNAPPGSSGRFSFFIIGFGIALRKKSLAKPIGYNSEEFFSEQFISVFFETFG